MEALIAFLTTTAGKTIAGLTIAATASAGGLHAADVIDIPVLPEQAQEEEELELDAGDEGDDVAEIESDEDESDEDETDLEAELDDESENEVDAAEAAEGKGVNGQDVAEDAQDGGVDGMKVRDDAIAGTPAEGKAATPTPGQPEELPEEAQQGQDRRPETVSEQPGDDASGTDTDEHLEEDDTEDDGEAQGGPETGAGMRDDATGAGES